MSPTHFYAALVHAPVRNRLGEEIAATVDEFDFFDMGRLSLTYPVRTLYIVQPVPAQQDRVKQLLAYGNSERRHAERGRFDRTTLVATLAEAVEAITAEAGQPPMVIATTARKMEDAISFAEARAQIATEAPTLVIFGKAWGLTDAVIEGADLRLAPIDTGTGYNHLSVRSAVAIILDRLLGQG